MLFDRTNITVEFGFPLDQQCITHTACKYWSLSTVDGFYRHHPVYRDHSSISYVLYGSLWSIIRVQKRCWGVYAPRNTALFSQTLTFSCVLFSPFISFNIIFTAGFVRHFRESMVRRASNTGTPVQPSWVLLPTAAPLKAPALSKFPARDVAVHLLRDASRSSSGALCHWTTRVAANCIVSYRYRVFITIGVQPWWLSFFRVLCRYTDATPLLVCA